jgi:hypothetical protein
VQSVLDELNNNVWHQVGVTYDTTTVRLYVDGQLDNSAAIALGPDVAGHVLRIGQRAGERFFRGSMDEAAFFDRQLSSAEIRAMYLAVPEPSALALALLGALVVAWLRWRSRPQSRAAI